MLNGHHLLPSGLCLLLPFKKVDKEGNHRLGPANIERDSAAGHQAPSTLRRRAPEIVAGSGHTATLLQHSCIELVTLLGRADTLLANAEVADEDE